MKKSLIYTCTGDNGTTSLANGTRLPKDDIRIEAYGTVDELNSLIGTLATSSHLLPEESQLMIFIQNKLFNIGAYLATEGTTSPGVNSDDITRIERAIDAMDTELPPMRNFVLPGGSRVSTMAHVCRTVARRAERRIITLSHTAPVDADVLRFINRLSDYLFVFARFNNVRNQIDEIFWDKDC